MLVLYNLPFPYTPTSISGALTSISAMYTYMRRHNWEDILSSLLSVIVLEQPVATDVDAFLLAKLEYLLAHKELPIRWDMFITSTCAQHNVIQATHSLYMPSHICCCRHTILPLTSSTHQ